MNEALLCMQGNNGTLELYQDRIIAQQRSSPLGGSESDLVVKLRSIIEIRLVPPQMGVYGVLAIQADNHSRHSIQFIFPAQHYDEAQHFKEVAEDLVSRSKIYDYVREHF